jgi:hypothetical protein
MESVASASADGIMVFGFIYQSFLIHPLTQIVLTSYPLMRWY